MLGSLPAGVGRCALASDWTPKLAENKLIRVAVIIAKRANVAPDKGKNSVCVSEQDTEQ